MVSIGMVLFGLGVGIVVGYIFFLLLTHVIFGPDFTLLLKIGLSLSGIGLLMVFLVVLRQRMCSNRYKYVKEAQA